LFIKVKEAYEKLSDPSNWEKIVNYHEKEILYYENKGKKINLIKKLLERDCPACSQELTTWRNKCWVCLDAKKLSKLDYFRYIKWDWDESLNKIWDFENKLAA